MNNKILSLFLIAIIFTLSSCSKEEEPTFEEILTSQLWVKSNVGVKYGTDDPDDENVPFEEETDPCNSKVLLSYSDDGMYKIYANNGCNNSNNYDRWNYISEDHFLIHFNSSVPLAFGYNVNSFSRERIELYTTGKYSGLNYVRTFTFIPFE